MPVALIVLYLYSTSNHNCLVSCVSLAVLYYNFIINQNTTQSLPTNRKNHCLIPLFYIKPQLIVACFSIMFHCLIPLFYIKPQPQGVHGRKVGIVLYLYSTSNHNPVSLCPCHSSIVLYLYSTSNHNYRPSH